MDEATKACTTCYWWHPNGQKDLEFPDATGRCTQDALPKNTQANMCCARYSSRDPVPLPPGYHTVACCLTCKHYIDLSHWGEVERPACSLCRYGHGDATDVDPNGICDRWERGND